MVQFHIMIRPILDTKDARLKAVSKEVALVDKKVEALIGDLKDTLNAQNDPEGVGLAAPQIGKNVRVFVMLQGKNLKVVINPKIIKIQEGTKPKRINKASSIMEGCLSLPHFYTPLKRAYYVQVSYQDDKGETKVEEFSGLDAQIIQHEIDHLDGILFIDRMFEQKKPLYEYQNGEWDEVEI